MEKIPGGLIWTIELAIKAALNVEFIRLSADSDKTLIKRLMGASISWNKTDPQENRIIFDTIYRTTGTPENIIMALRYAGVPDDNIQEVLDNAITKDNYLINPKYIEDSNRFIIRDEMRGVKNPYTPIEKAILLNFPWIVKYMIENENIDPREDDNKLYRYAVHMGNQEIVEYIKDEIIKSNWYEKNTYQSMFTPFTGSGTEYENIFQHTRKMYQ